MEEEETGGSLESPYVLFEFSFASPSPCSFDASDMNEYPGIPPMESLRNSLSRDSQFFGDLGQDSTTWRWEWWKAFFHILAACLTVAFRVAFV